jgi:hypothetical protein
LKGYVSASPACGRCFIWRTDFQHALAWYIHEHHVEEATGVPHGVGDAVAFSPAGSAAVRGKSEPVATYVPLVPEDTGVRSAARVPWMS